MSRFRVYVEFSVLDTVLQTRASGFEHECARAPCLVQSNLGEEEKCLMDYPGHRVTADKWSWRVLAHWIGPPKELFIMLTLLIAVYGGVQGFN